MSDRLSHRSHALAAVLAKNGWTPDVDPKKGKCWKHNNGGVVYRLSNGARPWVASKPDYPIHRFRTRSEAMSYIAFSCRKNH